MTVFDPRGELRGLQRARTLAALAEPERFITGDPANGFYTTPKPPDMGYWGITFHAKRINADLENPGNLLTWIANRMADFTGSEKRFVSVGAGSFMGAAAFGDSNARNRTEVETISGWKWLSNRFSPLQDVSEIDRILSFEDEKFDPNEALQEFVDNSPALAATLESEGRDLNMFLVATNRDAFQYILNREMMHIQALDRISRFNNQVGSFKNISSKLLSGAFNWLLFDPSFAPSLAIGVGGVQLAAGAERASVGILRAGGAITRARTAAQVAAPVRLTASAVSKVGGAPAAAHGALAARWGTAAATGVELGLWGVGWDAAIQQERIRDWNEIFEGTEWAKEFSFGELALSGIIGGALGFTLSKVTNAISGRASASRARRAAVEATGGDADSVVAREGFIDSKAIRAQAHEDTRAIRIQELAERISGNQHADLGFLLDRNLIDDAGLMIDDVLQFLETVATALDGEIVDSVPIVRLAQELLGQAKAARTAGDVTDAVTDMLVRQARNRSLMQALDEGINIADTAAIRSRIDDLTLVHLDALRRAPIETPVGVRADLDEDGLRKFLQDMNDLSIQRTLSDIEEEQMLWAARSLEFLTGQEFIPQLARRFNVSNFKPTSNFGKRMMDLHTDRQELEGLRRQLSEVRAVGANEDTIKKSIRRVQQRVRRRAVRVRELFPAGEAATGRPRNQVMKEASEKGKATTPADRERLFNEQWEAPDAGAASWMEDITFVGRVMRAAGLGQLFSRLATQKTGQYQTVRNLFAGIRQLAELFDHSRFTVESLTPTGPKFVGNLTDKQRGLIREFAPMAEFMDKLLTEGFFGKRLSAVTGRRRAHIDEFQEEAFLHAAGIKEADSPEARQLAELWNTASKKIGLEGVNNGTLRDLEEAFVPIRVEIGKVMRDKVRFRQGLTAHFTRKWLNSDTAHMDTLVTMGWAERIATPGRDVTYRLIGPLAKISDEPVSTLKRSQLGNLADEYTRGITEAVDDQGLTGVGASMRRVVNNLTSERTFIEESGRIIVDDATGAVSVFERRLDKDVLSNPELREFFRTDIMSLAHDYVRHSGFDIRANGLVQELTGIQGLTFPEYMNFVEKQLLRTAKEGTDEDRIIRKGVTELREKWMRMSGRERRLLSEAEKVGEFFAETAEAGTLAFFGGGIGHSITLTEILVGLVTRVYNPIGFAKQVRVMLSGLNPLQHRSIFKEYAGYTSLSVRLNQQINAERFTGGSIQSDFQWGTIDKILAPWRTLGDIIFGRTAPGPRSLFGRAEAIPQAVQALGRTSFQIGGADYATRVAWTLQLSSLQGETARFLPAARKLVDLLDENADSLATARNTARERALSGGKSDTAAIRAGNQAEFKAWKGLVRKAGFGSRWHVARRFAEHGMLDRTVLDLLTEAGGATGSLKTRGFLPMMDLNRMSNYVNDIDPGRADQMQDAINRVINSFEDTVRRRVSEQGILQTPTNEASRVYHGRMLNAMTSWSRSFFDNTVLDLAAMPSRNAAAIASAYVLGESLNRISKRIFNGEDFDTIMQEFEDRPIRTMLNYSLNVPVLGQFNFLLRAVTDPLLTERRGRQDFNQGAAVSVANETLNLVSQAVRAPFDEQAREQLSHSAEKFARRLTPGLNSHWGGLFLLGLENAFDTRLRMEQRGRNRGRGQRDFRFDFDVDRLPNGDPGDLLPPEDNIIDFSFMLPILEREER